MDLQVGFIEPYDIPHEYWDLADDRMPFYAYGGPEKYAEGSTPKDRNPNVIAARLMINAGRDKWQYVQAAIVREMRVSKYRAERLLMGFAGRV